MYTHIMALYGHNLNVYTYYGIVRAQPYCIHILLHSVRYYPHINIFVSLPKLGLLKI